MVLVWGLAKWYWQIYPYRGGEKNERRARYDRLLPETFAERAVERIADFFETAGVVH